MFSVTIPLFLLSLAPTLTLGDNEPCSLCTGFDESPTIDLFSVFGISGEDNRRLSRFLEDDYMLGSLSSCADLKTEITFLESGSPECSFVSVLAYSFCGCTDDPPADSCYSCSFGGTFDKDIVPEINSEMVGTCGEIAIAVAISDVLSDDHTGNETTSMSTSGSGDMEMDLNSCEMVQGLCGCDPNPDTCKICEYGLKNPDFKVVNGNDYYDAPSTCGEGVKLIELAISAGTMCDEMKDVVKMAGCKCNSSASTNNPCEEDDGNKFRVKDDLYSCKQLNRLKRKYRKKICTKEKSARKLCPVICKNKI